jgi:hypothetical protein
MTKPVPIAPQIVKEAHDLVGENARCAEQGSFKRTENEEAIGLGAI